jgi:hypothetical protein
LGGAIKSGQRYLKQDRTKKSWTCPENTFLSPLQGAQCGSGKFSQCISSCSSDTTQHWRTDTLKIAKDCVLFQACTMFRVVVTTVCF